MLHEVNEAGALFKSLHDTWADTTTPHGRLMLTILGGLAEFERSLIKARTDVGIKRAREAGIKFGRPSKLTEHQQEQALKLLDQGEPQSAVAISEAGALFKSLHDTWADTTTPHGRLMLTILGGLAEFERSLIKARTDVGIVFLSSTLQI
jgi:DNA invertase Pin-like site-specific DNA recombinase